MNRPSYPRAQFLGFSALLAGIIAVVLTLSGGLLAFATDATPVEAQPESLAVIPMALDPANVTSSVTDLTVTPNTNLKNGTPLDITFNWSAQITGTAQTYFKAGDVIDLGTNFGDLFNGTDTQTILHAQTGVPIATLSLSADGCTITILQAAEDYQMTVMSGSVQTGARSITAKDLGVTTEQITKQFTIGNASTNVTWAQKVKEISIYSSGQGSITTNGAAGGIFNVVANPGNTWTIVAMPNTDKNIVGVTLNKADGTSVTYPLGDGTSPQTYTVSETDLEVGLNSFVVTFTPEPSFPVNPNVLQKSLWGVDWGTHARNVIVVNDRTMLGLYYNTGTSLAYGGSTDQDNRMSNLILEDTIPGGAFGEVANLRIYAPLPPYHQYENGRYFFSTVSEWARGPELISSGYMTQVSQLGGESYDAFKARISTMPYTVGVWVNPSTQESKLIANFGSPGDTNIAGLKYSDLYASRLAADPILNSIVGDDNTVNGKVQNFHIDFYTDHTAVKVSSTFRNTATTSWLDAAGASKTTSSTASPYTISGASAFAIGDAGTLTIQKLDANDGTIAIAGATFNLEIKDGSGNWVPYTYDSEPVSGTTNSDGLTTIGVLISGEYRVVETAVPAPYSLETQSYTTAGGSQGLVNPDGTFTVTANDLATGAKGFGAVCTNAIAYNVLYDANGGTGTLEDSNNPYAVGSTWTVLSPDGAIERPGFIFIGWNNESNGTGTFYPVGSQYIMGNADITLYAQWIPKFPKPVASPTITKAFTADSVTRPANETFTVTVTPDAANPTDGVNGLSSSITLQEGDTVTIATAEGISFSKAGTYKFTLAETAGSATGYTYDTEKYVWTVVIEETATGYAVTANTVEGANVTAGNAITFINTYEPDTNEPGIYEPDTYEPNTSEPELKKSVLPNTGITAPFAAFITTVVGAGAIAFANIRRNKDRE